MSDPLRLRFNHYLRLWLAIFMSVVLLSGFSAFSQELSIKGKITDGSSGEVLPGVNVLLKGTSKGTVSDADGNYSLNDVTPGSTLVFSFIGYKAQEQIVGKQNVINVTLVVDASNLQEVVVVGYGAQKKVNLSGAVEVVDSKVLEARPIQNVAQGLQGAVPNLNIDFNSGEPGTAPKINIRGFTSINSGNPLILVDNVPVDPAELNFIAPSDIKSISVLKDASSAAIYGARAAFGVILITTKSGVRDGLSISYNNNFSWGKPTVLGNKITDPYIYMRMLETSTDNTPWDNINYTDNQYEWARQRSDNPNGTEPVRLNPQDNSLYEYMGNRDWTKYFLNNYTVSQRHNLSMAGKSGKTSYYLSGAYDSQNGAIRLAEDKFDRYTTRGKLEFKPYKWLSIGNNTSLAFTERSRPSQMSVSEIYNLFPTDWDKNPDGTWANSGAGRVGAKLTNGGRGNEKTNVLQTTFSTQLSFFEEALKFNVDYTIRRENKYYGWNQSKIQIGYGPTDIREEGTNTAYRSSQITNYSVFNAFTTYSKSFQKHNVTAILGYNQEANSKDWFSAQKWGVISSSLPTINLATGLMEVGQAVNEWAIRGAFYRLNYIYNDNVNSG